MFCFCSKRFCRAWVALLTLAVSGAYAKERASTEDVSFTAKCDNSQQKYLVIHPKNASDDQPHNLLILLHGHGSDRRQVLDDSVQEFRAARDAATARGMIVVAPDYRARTSWMGPKAEADVVQIIDELKKRYRIGKVIVAGASMGGASALTFAALHPELVDGVVSMNGTANHLEYENFQDAIAKSFGGKKVELPVEYKKRSAEYWPERLTMPVAITASGQDKTVPPESVVRLANTIKKLRPDDVLLIFREEAGHNTSRDDSKTAFEFVLSKVLPPAAALQTKAR